METTIQIKKHSKFAGDKDLEKLSREELIQKIQVLQAHNLQLQNILAKGKPTVKLEERKFHKPFDFSKCNFRHILLRILYLGWDYQGFTVQEDTTNTIEYHLFEALIKTCLIQNRESSNYHRSGRTDKGVSSFGQVVSIKVRSRLSKGDENNLDNEIDYCKILNRVLPVNIQCIAWSATDQSFSSRFDCKSRTYKYYFPKGNLDIEKMRIACKDFVGTHDFRNFCKMDVGNGVIKFVRNVLDFRIEPFINTDSEDEYSLYVAIISGNAFLWHQIRYMMGILFLIGGDKESFSLVKELLDVEQNPSKPEYTMANEVPLNLFLCEYDSIHWIYKENNLKCIIEKLNRTWLFHTIKGNMVKDMISNLNDYFPKESPQNLSQHLLSGVKVKKYIPVLKRQRCDSLETKIKHYSKRNRIEIIQN
ncbi:tRNA pseudouridine(38/39) synthase [Cylas formicarius]|uniref:tRNA pseudouridine(38/39) synthase n=1 Tax=Cylas formicarius TaxID=197179 RepID=UPI0029585A98|nr:tRNA pseudouridine(38/39) synthase [Cylas formicarius]